MKLKELRDIDHLNLFDFSVNYLRMDRDNTLKAYIFINRKVLGFKTFYTLDEYKECLLTLKSIYNELNKYCDLLKDKIEMYKPYVEIHEQENINKIESYLLKIKLEKELENKTTIKRTKI